MPDPLLTPMQLGHVLQSARKARKLSQANLGARIGLSQRRISALELQPDSINVEQLLKMCAALGLELSIGAKPGAQQPGIRGSKVEW